MKNTTKRFDLVRRFPLRAIESDQELERGRTLLNELLDRDKLDRDSDDYLDILGDLIERYERAHHPLPPVSDVDMLRHFLDSRGLTCTEAARGAGIAISTVSSVLAGKRKMNRGHIESLARFFRVAPGSFLGPPALAADGRSVGERSALLDHMLERVCSTKCWKGKAE